VVPALTKEFGYTNVMAVPQDHQGRVNMGLGEATQNAKIIDVGADELGAITGQKAAVTRAKKSIAQFKVREGMPIGAMVTLRGERMYEFLDRLIAIALPRVRDFRGVSPKGSTAAATTRSACGPADLPGDRLHEGRQGARHERLGRHDGQDRRGGAQAAAAARHAVPAELERGDRDRAPGPGIRDDGHDRQRSPRRRRRRSSRSACATAAAAAAGRAPTCGSSRCAACASASWRSRATSPGVTKSSW
jgi:hypothetical protein